MTKSILNWTIKLSALYLLCILSFTALAQKGNPKNQQEMQEQLKKAQAELNKLTPEQKKMMEQMGIKIPSASTNPALDSKNAAVVNKALQNEFGLVPLKDAHRISKITKGLTSATMPAYLQNIHQIVRSTVQSESLKLANKLLATTKADDGNTANNLALMIWANGKPEVALCLLGSVVTQWPDDNNINNYAAMLSMMGGEHLAIPVLEVCNKADKNNSTLLNNLGQAWLGLGEIGRAEKYLDSAIALYPMHPQANLSKAAIKEHQGKKQEAIDAVKKSMMHSYSQEKENKLRKLGYSLTAKDTYLPPKKKADLFALEGFTTPQFPLSAKAYRNSEWPGIQDELNVRISALSSATGQAALQSQQTAAKQFEKQFGVSIQDLSKINSASGVETMMKGAANNTRTAGKPLWYHAAQKKEVLLEELYKVKKKDYQTRLELYMKGEYLQKTKAYEEKKKRYDDIEKNCKVAGGGCISCEQWEQLADEYLVAVNPKLEQFYREWLGIQKVYLNQKAYLRMYQEEPSHYNTVTVPLLKAAWLTALAYGSNGGGGVKINIECIAAEKEEKYSSKIPDFDEEAFLCQYKSEVSVGVKGGSFNWSTDCSGDVFKLAIDEAGELKDIEIGLRMLKGEYKGSSLKFGVDRLGFGKNVKKGTWKLGGVAGVATSVEMAHGTDRGFDWSAAINVGVEGNVKTESEHGYTLGADGEYGVEFEIGKSGLTGVNVVGSANAKASIGGKGVLKVGVEGKGSLITGDGYLRGTGLLKDKF